MIKFSLYFFTEVTQEVKKERREVSINAVDEYYSKSSSGLPSKEDSPRIFNPKNEFWGWIVLIVFIFLVFAVGSTIDSVSPWKSLHGR